jgi:hypothetical protein
VAYGTTEALYRQCAVQANYDIPQMREKGGIVPKSETGEELGVGDSWWYKGMLASLGLLHEQHSSMVRREVMINILDVLISHCRRQIDAHVQYLGSNNLSTYVHPHRPLTTFPSRARASMAPAPP